MSEPSALQRAVQRAKMTRQVVLAERALECLPEVAAAHLDGRPLVIVCDDNTRKAAGAEVEARLAAAGRAVAPLVLPGAPRLKPRIEYSRRIAEALKQGANAVAVGSGVVNDLTKYASALAGAPYICVPTAASMDGYSASGAPLLNDGFKRTVDCPPPVAVVADPAIAVAAPAPMASWGYGDLAGKISAGGDWILADGLGEEAISAPEWDMVQGNLAAWLRNPEGVRDRDRAAVRGLLEGLLTVGFAMQSYGNSRPASGSDHQFSHLWEMEGLSIDGIPAAHGACVGIGCLASLALYDWLLSRDLTAIDVERLVARRRPLAALEDEVRAAFSDRGLADASIEEVRAKHPDEERLRTRLWRLAALWPDLRARLAAHLPRAAEVRGRLAVQGLPVRPADLGLSLPAFARDIRRAWMIRRRYTVFDVLVDLGLFEEAVAATTAAGGFWHGSEGVPGRRADGG